MGEEDDLFSKEVDYIAEANQTLRSAALFLNLLRFPFLLSNINAARDAYAYLAARQSF